MNIAIILAGGSGKRMSTDLPKQFLKVAGKTVLEHTVTVFQSHPEITEIAIVGNVAYLHLIEDMVLKNKWSKVKKILNGGKERYESSLSAIRAYETEDNPNLIFHDAVRPLVNHRIISDNIKALATYNAVSTAISTSDTLFQIDSDSDCIKKIPDRSNFRKAQTPQSFKLQTIKKAHALASKDTNFTPTDDCGVVKRYLSGEKIFLVNGSTQNIKLTYKEDILFAQQILKIKGKDIFNTSL